MEATEKRVERTDMHAEWDAWQLVASEWREAIGDINDAKYNRVVKAIQRWGEFIVRLRSFQSDADRATAFTQNCERYDREKAGTP